MSNFTESQPKTKKQQQKKENNGPFLYVKICEAFQSTGEAQHELLGGKKEEEGGEQKEADEEKPECC